MIVCLFLRPYAPSWHQGTGEGEGDLILKDQKINSSILLDNSIPKLTNLKRKKIRGVARIFQRGVTVCQNTLRLCLSR